MICTLTARKLKPGTASEFVNTFESAIHEAPEEFRSRWDHVYICRDVADDDTILSFGFFDGSLEELREIQPKSGRDQAVSSTEEMISSILLDGAFEVIAEIQPQHA
jgi:hypothetical protein